MGAVYLGKCAHGDKQEKLRPVKEMRDQDLKNQDNSMQ